jgi:hypothetical protein
MMERFLMALFVLAPVLFSPAGYALCMTGNHYRQAPCHASPSASVSSSGNHKMGVLLLICNVHFTEVSRSAAGYYALYDFIAGGMTHVNSDYASAANKHRVAGPYVEHNIGLVDIDRVGDPEPFILNYEFSLGNLK